jgi:hypothetical protein
LAAKNAADAVVSAEFRAGTVFALSDLRLFDAAQIIPQLQREQRLPRLRPRGRALHFSSQRTSAGLGLKRPSRPDATTRYSRLALNLAAIASTSTLNSSRVKPETIISVEAGGGSAA